MAILVSGEQQHHEKLENNRVISQVLTSTSNFKVKNVEGIFFSIGMPTWSLETGVFLERNIHVTIIDAFISTSFFSGRRVEMWL